MFNKKFRTVAILAFVLIFSMGSECPPPASDQANVTKMRATPIGIVDYGNGVYYFHYTESEFGNILSTFIEEHKSLIIVTIAPDNSGGSGNLKGYFVIFREK